MSDDVDNTCLLFEHYMNNCFSYKGAKNHIEARLNESPADRAKAMDYCMGLAKEIEKRNLERGGIS